MRSLLLSAIVIALSAPGIATARDYAPYLGVQGQKITWKQGSVVNGFRADVDAASGLVGVAVNDIVGIEARYGTGVDGETVNGVDVELDRSYGFYVRATLPTGKMFAPYAIAGYTNTRLEFDGEAADDSEDDGSWGGGVTLSLDGPVTLDAEWINYIDKDGFDIDAFNLGLNYRF